MIGSQPGFVSAAQGRDQRTVGVAAQEERVGGVLVCEPARYGQEVGLVCIVCLSFPCGHRTEPV